MTAYREDDRVYVRWEGREYLGRVRRGLLSFWFHESTIRPAGADFA